MNRESASVVIKTAPPARMPESGLNSIAVFAARSTYQDFVWDRSRPAVGPFCTDVDGNVILDFVSHVASSALGTTTRSW